ncbi:MAG: sugar phosphate isomerase/epimerase [Planctomycetes bacterium]|nr:sugar phosphate isomerase/epimerase [Planctomycetota bacterium]
MLLGYNTNGFAHHRLDDALRILSDLGCQSVAITLDYHALNPFDVDIHRQCDNVRSLLERLKLRCVIETGARFLLDPRRKHQPTLLSASADERQRRLDFLRRAIEIAHRLNADGVSFWSGTPSDAAPEVEHWSRLIDGCRALGDEAAKRNVRLAFEPEPGMLIDTMAKFAELHRRVGHPSFGLTLDVGHLHCQGELPIAEHIQRWKAWLWNVHIEDMRRGVHDHLMFGEGEMDYPPIFQALRAIDYRGGLHVELSRHSHDAVNTATRALAFLRGMQ